MFKKLVIAGAIVAAATGSALAETKNVDVYGRLDMGVVSVDNVGTNQQRLTHLTSSPIATSHIGFRGTEDLGGGLKASFMLESQINPADGTQGVSSGSGSANAVFGREANLALSSDLGTVRIGRQVMPVYQYFNQSDVRGGMGFGSSLVYFADGSTFGGTATAKTGVSAFTGGTYGSNIVSYQSPNMNGFTVRAMYGFGNTAGDLDYSKKLGLGALYDKGAIIATVGHYETYSSAGVKNGETQFVGGGVRVTDRWIVRGGYATMENPNGAGAVNTKFDLRQVSTAYNVTSDVMAFVGYYNFKDKITAGNESKMVSTGVEKSLSKRTKIYALAAQQDNAGTMGFAAYGGGGANYNSLSTSQYQSVVQSGGKTTAYALGMVHTF